MLPGINKTAWTGSGTSSTVAATKIPIATAKHAATIICTIGFEI